MGDFTDYASKKKLLAAHVLTDEQFAFIDSIKGFFGAAVHSGKRYVAMTLYRANSDPQYSFLIVDLNAKTTEQAESIKKAKQAIRERNPQSADKVYNAIKPVSIPCPSCAEVDKYLHRWNTTPDLYEPETVLRELFTEAYPHNRTIDEIILKAAALNSIYNTRITSIYPISNHILSLDIDERLRAGDETLVNELMGVDYISDGETDHTDHYSFATKFCSFHNPDAFPIYDSYVDAILWHYHNTEHFSEFYRNKLKDYPTFKRVIGDFRRHFGLEQYTVKELDQFLWQYGKDFF